MNSIKKIWNGLWVVSSKKWMVGLPLGGIVMFFVGVIFLATFNVTLEATNNEEFCISCHEMKDNVYAEYTKTIHYKNNSGVRASCPDCHIPRPFVDKLLDKLSASRELYHNFLGTIDTREKFEKRRLELAERVWAEMRANDSRECRNCHTFDAMDLENQSKQARRKHEPKRVAERGETCIDCHQGIAHDLPEEDFEEES